MTEPQISSPSDFKRNAAGVVLALPSGFTIRARRVSLQTFIKQGVVPNGLMAMVQSALDKGQDLGPSDVLSEDGELDMDQLREMMQLVDEMILSIVMEPRIHRNPPEGVDDDMEKVYQRDILDEDKMFVYQWAMGGTADVATFREEASADLDALAAVPVAPGAPQ